MQSSVALEQALCSLCNGSSQYLMIFAHTCISIASCQSYCLTFPEEQVIMVSNVAEPSAPPIKAHS